jgi:hydroxymethylpyrimidine kinase/phosphomethylpyrimidine kinase
MIPNVLSIAGSDPSGGAGIQADLKTFAALGCYGMAAITALTVQNTQGVSGVFDVPSDFVRAQIEAIFEDIEVAAVKIGMLAQPEIIYQIVEVLEKYKPPFVVLDPVMVATSGDSLISSGAIDAIKDCLIPLVDVITPNIAEAQKLSRKAVLDMHVAAQELLVFGSGAVLLKGGHLKERNARDVLAMSRGAMYEFSAPRIDTLNTHGTGCTLSSAIAAYLAKGEDVPRACEKAKAYLSGALKASEELQVGRGHGPVHHGWRQ